MTRRHSSFIALVGVILLAGCATVASVDSARGDRFMGEGKWEEAMVAYQHWWAAKWGSTIGGSPHAVGLRL